MSAAASKASKPVITFFDPAQHHASDSEGLHFSGTATFADGSTARISVQMTSETLSSLSGTAMVDDTRPGAVRNLFVLRGTGSRSGIFSLHGVAVGNSTVVVNGMMSRDREHAAGQFVMTSLGKPAIGGTFSASRQSD
jgi:hypothetical protein